MTVRRKPEVGTVTFRMNKKIWKESEKALAKVGVSRSQFIGIVLREVVRSVKEETDVDMVDRIREALLWMGLNMMIKKKE